MLLTKSNLDYETIRRLVLEVIKNDNFNQYGGIVRGVADLMVKYGYTSETKTFSGLSSKELDKDDEMIVSEIIWDLIIQRVLTIGLDERNNHWPFLRLTEYGKRVVNNSDNVIIYDIDGMMKMLQNKIPNVDETIKNYFEECLNTYRINAMFASSVMLGCCAEKSICILFDSYLQWIKNNASEKEYNKILGYQRSNISRKFEELTKSINGHKSDIDQNLFEDYDLLINSVFTLIRKNRNDAGHPVGKEIDRDELRAMIYVFINHCKKIYDFINYFINDNSSESSQT